MLQALGIEYTRLQKNKSTPSGTGNDPLSQQVRATDTIGISWGGVGSIIGVITVIIAGNEAVYKRRARHCYANQ